VGRKGFDSKEQLLVKIKGNEAKEVNNRLAEVEKSEMSSIVKAQIFEEKEMYANAVNAYEEAIKSNDSEQFQNLYKAFLMRNNLSPEAKATKENN
jgi:hypothetical protein